MKGTIGIFVCLILLGSYPGISYAGWFGITDYADCIFSSLKNVGSDKAVVAVVSACKRQYPEKPSPGWLAPENYDACVTNNMNGIINDRASLAIMDTCYLLYHKPKIE